MNLKCIRQLINFLLFFVCTSFAQNNTSYPSEFYTYLKQQNLYAEQITYLNSLQSTCGNVLCSDTLFLNKALCFYALNNTEACGRMVDSIKTLFSFSEANFHEKYVSLLFTQKKIGTLKKNSLFADTTLNFNRKSKTFLQILCREKINISSNDSAFAGEHSFQSILFRYKHQPRKSPLAAGLLSAVVPGLGKLYAGYKYQAISSFVANILFASQTAEAIIRSGFKSAHFIYTCTLFSVYYISNIIGSVMATKKKKRDYLNQLDDEIIYDYSNRIGAYTN